MKSINKSISLNIYIGGLSLFFMNLFDSENMSISIILNDIIFCFDLPAWGLMQILSHFKLFIEIDLIPWVLTQGKVAY